MGGCSPAIGRRTPTSIGLSRWGRRQLRGRRELPLPHSSGRYGVALRAHVAVVVDERGRRGMAAIRSARSGRPVLDLPPRTGATQPTVQSFGQFFGSETELTQLLAPLRDSGGRLTTGTSTYLDLMKRWAGCRTIGFDECHLAPEGSLARTGLPPSRTTSPSRCRPPASRPFGRGSTAPRQRGRRGAPRRLRRRDQPRRARRDGVRPPARALLDPVLRRDRQRYERRSGSRVAARLQSGDAAARLRTRVSELHRPGSHRLGSRVTTARTTHGCGG